ncbi:hypothetical protein JTB14_020661 [Gonioctena quinquepunctata]|nr:hypothetical protein JTB14_020661 [Gonioctena quinquepunctata]
MDIRPVYLVLILNFVSGKSVKDPCQTYHSINKENIRNCVEDRKEVIEGGLGGSFSDSGNGENNVTGGFIDDWAEKMTNSSDVAMEIQLSNYSVVLSYKTDNGVGKKMKTSMNNMLQYMLVPALLMSGIMPWVMPKLQMMVSMVAMMNNMIFGSALFSLVRSYVFDKEPAEHVIYVNHGYKNKGHHHYR